jgi:hypothetical protein
MPPNKILSKRTIVLRWVVWIVIAAIAVGLIVGIPLWQRIQRASFEPYLAQYAAIQPNGQASSAHMRGKMIVIDKSTGSIDPTWDEIPDDMRAASPSQVATVVWLEWSESEVGTYQGGGSGYSSNVEVTVIDKATSKIIATKSFSSQPTGVRVAGGSADTVAKRPEDQVVQYLRTLGGEPESASLGLLSLVTVAIVLVGMLGIAVAVVRVLKARERRRSG